MFGYSSKDLLNKNISQLIPSAISSKHDELISRYIKKSYLSNEENEIDDDEKIETIFNNKSQI